MRKYILASLFLILFLTACSQKIEEEAYYINNNGNETEITYYFKNDVAFKQSTVSKVSYENLNVENEEAARKALASTNSMYEGSKGISHNIEYNEDYLIERISVEYKKIEKEDLEQLAILIGNSANAKDLTSEKIEVNMESLGFKSSVNKETVEKEIEEYIDTINNFTETNIEEIQNIKDKKIILYVGFKECPYCRIFAPKLLEASYKNGQGIFYLDTTLIGESPQEIAFIDELQLETVPALYIIENGKKIEEFDFYSSETISIGEIESFLQKNK